MYNSDLPESIQRIVDRLNAEKEITPAPCEIIQLVKEANVRKEDILQWKDFNHPPQDSYGQKSAYHDDAFEITIRSWLPGDYSAIHDNGNISWGAIQVFGPAEHAVFRLEDDLLTTVSRTRIQSGDILRVRPSLIHQMGNPTADENILTLHIYGTADGDNGDSDRIIVPPRIFALEKNVIQSHNGGMFFALDNAQVDFIQSGIESDYMTRLRHMVELCRRLERIQDAGKDKGKHRGKDSNLDLDSVLKETFSTEALSQLREEISMRTDDQFHVTDSVYWRNLNHELREAAALQKELKDKSNGIGIDHFHQYALVYDALICEPMLNSFMKHYLHFFKNEVVPDISSKSIISIGVGTGLVEQFMMDELGVDENKLYGIDISESMVEVARKRLKADVGDVLTLDPAVNKLWDVAYTGLNVLQYVQHHDLQNAIDKTASIVKSGGWFLGDFITPDHIRWYPNVMYSTKGDIISLRTPRLVEEYGKMFQQSEIINLDFTGQQLAINYAGKHKRYLSPMHRLREFFERAFKGRVDFYDSKTMDLISSDADTCSSTRYVIMAQKGVD